MTYGTLPGVYRPSRNPPKGAWAIHLQAQRKERNLSATQAFELVQQRMHWSKKSRSAYVAIDQGDRQPREDEAAILAAEFGWPVEGGSSTAGDQAGNDPLIAAITRQSIAMERLVALLTPLVEDRAEGLMARLAELEAVVGPLAGQALAGLPVHVPPRGVAG